MQDQKFSREVKIEGSEHFDIFKILPVIRAWECHRYRSHFFFDEIQPRDPRGPSKNVELYFINPYQILNGFPDFLHRQLWQIPGWPGRFRY